MSAPQTAITNQMTKVITGKVRFSYVFVFTPRAPSPGQDPKYSVRLLIPKSDRETLHKIKAAIEAAKQQGLKLWGGKLPAGLKSPVRDGDEEFPDQPEYAGHYFVNASSKQKPGLVDRFKSPIEDSTDLYSGCYGRASLNFFPFNQAGNRGIGCGLNHLQKLADGDYLGGRSRAEDDFDDDFLADESDDSFLL